MTDYHVLNKPDLLAAVDNGWNNLQNYLGTLTYEQATIPTDPAGWTVKDHIAHLAVWEDSINALLDKHDRPEHMKIDPELWASQDFDQINAVIQQRYHDITLKDLRVMFSSIHERLRLKIELMSEDELMQPYKDYQPGSDLDIPVSYWVTIDTYQHYAEHITWMDAIASQYATSVANFLAALQAGWDDLNLFVDGLTDQQLTELTDPAGWTVKDHVMHLAVWEDGVNVLLDHQPRPPRMGVDQAIWDSDDIDRINAFIQQQHHDLSWDEVQQRRQAIHAEFVQKLQALSDADLMRPYRDFDPSEDNPEPVLGYLVGDSFGHYAEHRPWMEKIVGGE